MKLADISFKIFNADGTKNREATRFASQKVKVNGHKKRIDAVVTNLNGMDIFLGYNWLVKHNPEVNWKTGTICFKRCPKTCRIQHQDILFTSKTRRIQPTDNQDKEHQEIEKELNLTNPEDLLEYIQPFTHLFNKKKFKKLPGRREWDHKINLMKDALKELNVKAYTMTIKKEKTLNKWLDKQLQAELIMKSSS